MKSLFTFLILLFSLACSYSQKGVPNDFCLTDDEFRLYELINAHRVANGLKEIPLSASLSFVAHTHVEDLYTNHPDTSICNLNSWSDKGDWTACCHNKYIPQEDCIRNKPKELSNYSGEGYELTYAEVFSVSPDTVFMFWKKLDVADDFLLNQGRWDDKTWRALGIGIYNNYAVIWMGERKDALSTPEPCTQVKEPKSRQTSKAVSSAKVEVITGSSGRFYIVIASFQSLADARTEVKRLAKVAGSNIKILKNDQGKYRLSIDDYASLDAAKQGKKKYKKDFTDAWVLQY